MTTYTMIDGAKRKLSVSEFKQKKANAYALGALHGTFAPTFVFEDEFYKKGEADDFRLRHEIQSGQR